MIDRITSAGERRITRRQALRAGIGLAGVGLLTASRLGTGIAAAAPSVAPASQGDLNEYGWPRSIPILAMGFIPLEDQIQQRNTYQPFIDFIQSQTGVPVEMSITTSYAALVEAQRNGFATVGYYGALSFLFAEQQFGAIPLVVDSADGVTPGAYQSLLLAGRESPVTTVQEIRGQDFTFVDPASTSGNLFPRVMLLEEGIDPNRDIRGRYAGNHQNSVLAIARGQVPCGASSNLSVDAAINRGVIGADELVILKVSADIPNGPFAVSPDLDPRAAQKIQEIFGAFDDTVALRAMELTGRLIPVDTSAYNFVRRAATVINLQFDERGVPVPVG